MSPRIEMTEELYRHVTSRIVYEGSPLMSLGGSLAHSNPSNRKWEATKKRARNVVVFL